MARNSTHTLVMSPGQRLEVSASPDVGTAIVVAREALKYLQGTSYHLAIAAAESLEQEQVDDEAWSGHYVLTCLLCGLAHPQSPGKSDLVAMQEHHMEVHGFKAEDLRLALRVNLSDDKEYFIWALAPAQANALGLKQLCYLRAVKKSVLSIKPAAQPQDTAPRYTTLVQKSSFDGTPRLQEVLVTGQDEHAWYGYHRGDAREEEPPVWPRGEWELSGE
jgi:hypothetical protein